MTVRERLLRLRDELDAAIAACDEGDEAAPIAEARRQALGGETCGRCGAKKDRRVDVGGFGGAVVKTFACGACGADWN